MKRVVLFLLTNIAIIAVITIVTNLLGVNRYFTEQGLDYGMLLAFCAVVGFTGAFISLLMSKTIAKWSVGAKVIDMPRSDEEAWLKTTVSNLASKAGLPMPEVAIYHGEPNAFATGPSKSNSLVAVSDGLLACMDRNQAEAVLAHEMTHIANGDMVTLTLIQGVINTFVIFLARVAAFAVDSFVNKNDNNSRRGPSFVYYICDFVFQLIFAFLASIIVCLFSRKREYRADAGAAKLMGSNRYMIDALKVLGGMETGALPKSMAASGIAGGKSFMELFSTHPTIENRIAALEKSEISAWNN